MTTVFTRKGFVEDTAPEPVALADFLTAPGNITSVILEPNSRLEELEPYLGQLAVITIRFPKFNDGRGYSLAARLRIHYGYQGVLRATGEVLTDQIQHFFRQGFDALVVTHTPTLARLHAGRPLAYDIFMQADIQGKESAPASGANYSWRRAV